MDALTIWIDATGYDPELRVFGMGLLERQLRAVASIPAEIREVRIELPGETALEPTLPGDLLVLPLRWSRKAGSSGQRFADAVLGCSGDPVLAVSADAVVDARLLRHFATASGRVVFLTGDGDERAALLRWEGPPPPVRPEDGDLTTLAERLVSTGEVKPLPEGEFDDYITNLRRTLAPYARRIRDAAARDRIEHFLFWSNYKGSTDFLTRYVYPPLVWRMVRPLARWRVHPNWVTAVDWVATFAAIPLFASGAWVPGLALAYLMTVLDSVDGKLARLTFTSSRLGEILDHGLDIVHPPFWYMAWAWALGGGGTASTPFQASLWMLGLYVADRLLALVFKTRTGRSIHGFTPLDERVRTFVSRRNVNLAMFTGALLVDAVLPGHHVALWTFYAIVAWQALSFLWHAERVLHFWNARGSGKRGVSR